MAATSRSRPDARCTTGCPFGHNRQRAPATVATIRLPRNRPAFGQGGADPRRPAQLAGGLIGGVVNGLVERAEVLRAAVQLEPVRPGKGAQLVASA